MCHPGFCSLQLRDPYRCCCRLSQGGYHQPWPRDFFIGGDLLGVTKPGWSQHLGGGKGGVSKTIGLDEVSVSMYIGVCWEAIRDTQV